MTDLIFDVQLEGEPTLITWSVVQDRNSFVVILPASLYHAGTEAGLDMRGCTPAQMIPRADKLDRFVLRKERPEPPVYPGARPARITRFRR